MKNLKTLSRVTGVFLLLIVAQVQVSFKPVLLVEGIENTDLAKEKYTRKILSQHPSSRIGLMMNKTMTDDQYDWYTKGQTIYVDVYDAAGVRIYENHPILPNEKLKMKGEYTYVYKTEIKDSWIRYSEWDKGNYSGWWRSDEYPPEEKPVLEWKKGPEYIKAQTLSLPLLVVRPSREHYFDACHAISSAVDERIHELIRGSPEDFGMMTREMFERRRGKVKLRSCLTFFIARTMGIEDIHIDILVISELHNYRLYLPNMLIDNKNDIARNHARIQSAVIELHLIDGVITRLIDSVYGRESSLHREFAQANYLCHQGQYQDVSTTFTDCNHWDEHAFVEFYRNRCRLLSGAPLVFSAKLVSDNSQVHAFAEQFGIAVHVMQDVSDFSFPGNGDTGFKLYQDQLSDIKNRRLTFPIFHLLKEGNDLSDDHTLCNIVDTFKNSSALQVSLEHIKSEYLVTKSLLQKLPEVPTRAYLSRLILVARWNKYLSWLRA